MNHSILELIRSIRESFPQAAHVYTHGGCYRFFLILKQVYPEADAYYDSNHVITRIGDRYYDITGEVQPKRHHTLLSEDPGQEARVKEQCYFVGPLDKI